MSLTNEQVNSVDVFLAKLREVLLSRLYDPYDNIQTVTAEFRKDYNSSNINTSIMLISADVDTTESKFKQLDGSPNCTMVTVEDWHSTIFDNCDIVAAIRPIFDEFKMFFNFAVLRTEFFNGCVSSKHLPYVWFIEGRHDLHIPQNDKIAFSWSKSDDLLNDSNIIDAQYIEEMRQVFMELMHSFVSTHAQSASSNAHPASSAE